VLHISIRQDLELYFGRAKPTKAPPFNGTVWQNRSWIFNAIVSEKCLGYAICQSA